MTLRNILETLRKWLLILKLVLKKRTGMQHSFESLYKALSGERGPGFDTILKVIGALGLKLHAKASHG